MDIFGTNNSKVLKCEMTKLFAQFVTMKIERHSHDAYFVDSVLKNPGTILLSVA
jgi:hypothetical protein